MTEKVKRLFRELVTFSKSRPSPEIGRYPEHTVKLTVPFSKVEFGGVCLQKILVDYHSTFQSVLDIGSGEGQHAEVFRKFGKDVTEVDFGQSEYFLRRTEGRDIVFGDYLATDLPRQFDLVWACHVLEHQPNVNQFLRKVFTDLKDSGILAITIPPLKHEVVGGHLTLWNAGLLMYNLVLAGFDCRDAKILQYGYNISLILKKHPAELPELAFDKGDIERLVAYFPPGTSEPFDGNIRELNWFA